jgi:porphobilinogen synthase
MVTPLRSRQPAEAEASSPLPLTHRHRRNRKAEWARRLVRENVLTTNDLIWPIFLIDGERQRVAVGSMPGSSASASTRRCARPSGRPKLDIPCIAFFPYTDPALKDETGAESLNERNLVCRACRAIKAAVPEIGLLTDVALDPYTSHGHDG